MEDRIIPTEGERRNGWTSETLTRYVRAQEESAANRVLNPEPQKPRFQNSKYNPHRWRR